VAISGDASTDEATAVAEALRCIEENQLRNVIVESDSKFIVDRINHGKPNRSYWGRIAEICSKKVKSIDKVSVAWIRREGNKVAHHELTIVFLCLLFSISKNIWIC